MEKGLQPGADFFDDGSSGSDWEDSDGEITHTFSDVENPGLRSFIDEASGNSPGSARGRSRERSTATALPTACHLPSQTSASSAMMGDETWSKLNNGKRAERAREISLRQLSKDSIRIVHNRSNTGTPRGSIRSNASSINPPFGTLSRLFPTASSLSTELPRGDESHRSMRRDTADSIIAGSIVDAHVMTMRALESLTDTPSGNMNSSISHTLGPSSTVADFPAFSSLTDDRHITLSPLSIKRAGRDRDRPDHLPNYFIRTPYPFTAKKEFPKPKSRPRQHVGTDRPYSGEVNSLDRLDSGYDDNDSQKEYDDRKGKHVLGLKATTGQYDLRSRLERNEEAQGIIRSRPGSGKDDEDSTVWLSLQKHACRKDRNDGRTHMLVKITVPGSLTITRPTHQRSEKGGSVTVDFDDKYFAERLRHEYKTLAGNWFKQTFSARKLKDIRLSQFNTWSGTGSQPSRKGTSGLLATGAGIDMDDDPRSPFTERSLMNLYQRPSSGKARYTWVHWAQRVAASNTALPTSRCCRRLEIPDNDSFQFPQPIESATETGLPETVTTIQFVHVFSTLRITIALGLMLMLSVAAALLWVFLGSAGTGIRMGEDRQRSDRMGSGMAIGILVLLVESAGFGLWVWRS
jgi:hypothetical protein